MGLLRTLLIGRSSGLRARLCRAARGMGGTTTGAGPDTPSTDDAGWAGGDPGGEPALGLTPEAPKDITPPEGYEVVLHKDALAAGRIVEIIIGGTAIAVANVDGTFYACTNSCPHAGGPLGEGSLDGSLLTCPYHGWTYDLEDGSCKTKPDVVLPKYDVVVVDDAVCVRL